MKKTTNSNANGFDDTIRTMATNFTNNVLSELSRMVVERIAYIIPADSPIHTAAKGRAAGLPEGLVVQDVIPAARKARGRRLARRTPQDINRALERVVGILSARKEPLGAEHIRAELKIQRKELPRILRAGLESGVLRSAGEKRATRYSLVATSAGPAKKTARAAGKSKKA